MLLVTLSIYVTALCRCSTSPRGPPDAPAGFGYGCAAHDDHVALSCKIVSPGASFNHSTTGVVRNAAHCSRPWCYVEDPHECFTDGQRTAHLSFYDSLGQEWMLFAWGMAFGILRDKYPYFINYQDYGAPLFYSYEVCGSDDLYTLPAQKLLENEYEKKHGPIPLTRPQNDKAYDVANIPVRCVSPDGRLYPWDDNNMMATFRDVYHLESLTHQNYYAISPWTYHQKIPLHRVPHIRDGNDGYYPMECASPAHRYAELGRETRFPRFCYVTGGFTAYFRFSFQQSITSPVSVTGAMGTVSFLAYGICGDSEPFSQTSGRYTPNRLSSMTLIDLSYWLKGSNITHLTEDRIANVLTARSDARVDTVLHIDECAITCSGTPGCSEWAFFNNETLFVNSGDAGTLSIDDENMYLTVKGRVVGIKRFITTSSTFKILYSETINTADDFRRAFNSSSTEVDLRSSSDEFLHVRPTSDVYYQSEYRSCRCYTMSKAAADALRRMRGVNDTTTSTFIQTGRIVGDAHKAAVAHKLRSASVDFFTSSKVGQWLRSTVLADKDYFELQTRVQQLPKQIPLMWEERERKRIDSASPYVQSDVARMVMQLVLRMRTKRVVMVGDVVANVVYFRSLDMTSCRRTYLSPGIETCPDVKAVAHDEFVMNKQVHPWEQRGVATTEEERTVTSEIKDKCADASGALIVANATDVFIIFKDTEYTSWGDTLNSYNKGKDKELCTVPYVPGKVHCGAAQLALRVVSLLLATSTVTTDADVCTLFMQNKRCSPRPRLHFGGFSLGSAVCATTVMFLTGYMRYHYDIELSDSHVSIDLWGNHNFANKVFVDAFMEEWGPSLHVYSERTDLVANYASIYSFGGFRSEPLKEANAQVLSVLGSCGLTTTKKLKECYDFCDFDNINFDACYGWLVATLSQSNEAHELVALSMLHPSELPSKTSSGNSVFNTLAAGIDWLDATYEYYTADPFSTCLEDAWADTMHPWICDADSERLPWTYNPFVDWRRRKRGERTAWCLREYAHLRSRNKSTTEWSLMCCLSSADADDVQELQIMTSSFTGNEGFVPPSPYPPPTPRAPPPPDHPTAPPEPPLSPRPPSLPPRPPLLPGNVLLPYMQYDLSPVRWEQGTYHNTLLDITDHHRVTVTTDTDIRVTALAYDSGRPGPTSPSRIVSLSSNQLVVVVGVTDPITYTYSVYNGELRSVTGSIGGYVGLCSQPCQVTIA